MNRKQFLRKLKRELRYLPREEIVSSLRFYDEAISERIEHGLNEAEATAALGSPEAAAGRILAELPDEAVRQLKAKRRFRSAISIPALIIGFPVWIALLAAGVSVVISLAAAYFAVTVSMYAAAISLVTAVVPCMSLLLISGSMGNGLMCISAALACIGLGILCMLAAITMTKAGIRGLRKVFRVRRRRAVEI